MTLNLHRGMRWPIVCHPSGALLNCQKECIPREVHSLLPEKLILGGTPGLPVVHCTMVRIHMVHPGTVPFPSY